MQDAIVIHEFSWMDSSGRHSTTTVGMDEYRDQVAYITTLEKAELVWDAEATRGGYDV